MARVRGWLLALALGTAASGGWAKDWVFPVADTPVLGDHYPDRVTRFPGGVTGYADVIYAQPNGFRPLVVDVYVPTAARTARRPLVLYIHGGGWVGGHMRQAGALANFPETLASLANEGFVVASLEYRLSGEAPFPAQLQDVRAAIRFLKANAAKYGIDPARVGVWGGSAGGHLAALAALSCGAPGFDAKPEAPGSECVQAAAIWYGVFDFAPVVARAEAARNALLGCARSDACPADRVRAVSPLTYLDPRDPPFLLIHGKEDRVVSVAQSDAAFARMKAAGVKVEEIVIPGVDHSFIGASPAGTRAATLRAVNATFDFFHATLDAPRR